MDQPSPGEVDQRGKLLGALQRTGFKLQGPKGLQPRDDATQQQHGQQEKRAPEKADFSGRTAVQWRRDRFEGRGLGFKRNA
ncbi:hypothetical protein D9M68_740730 [compost metagenome]